MCTHNSSRRASFWKGRVKVERKGGEGCDIFLGGSGCEAIEDGDGAIGGVDGRGDGGLEVKRQEEEEEEMSKRKGVFVFHFRCA